jgi:hypothetical protein
MNTGGCVIGGANTIESPLARRYLASQWHKITEKTVNSVGSGLIFVQISGIRANPLKYTDPDGRTPKPGISLFLNPFQSNYDEDPIKQFGNAGWQLLGILNLFTPQTAFDNGGMATASAEIITGLTQNTKTTIAVIGLFMSLTIPRDPNFRKNLADRTGINHENHDAHHNLPVKLNEYFNKAKIKYQNPKFGSWVERNIHQGMNKEFQTDWEAFAEQNPDASAKKIIDFARNLAKKYGVATDF